MRRGTGALAWALMLCTVLAACSTARQEPETGPYDTSGECEDFGVNHKRGGLGFADNGEGQPIDEQDPKLRYEHVHIHQCGVQLVNPLQPVAKEEYGLKMYRLYQEDGETPFFISDQDLGRITHIVWDEGTVKSSLVASKWTAIPTHAFQCKPTESDDPNRPFTCDGTVVLGVEASVYEGKGWDISAGLSTPEVKGVKLKFAGSKSGKSDYTVAAKQQNAPNLVWANKNPVVWNAVLHREDRWIQTGRGKPCYEARMCLDWAQLEVTVTSSILISTQTNNWEKLLSPNGDWRRAATRGLYGSQPFDVGKEPEFGTKVSPRSTRTQISSSVRGVTASWSREHTYMKQSDVAAAAEADFGVVSGGYGKTTSKAYGDGTSTAVDMKYEAPDDVTSLCLTVMDIFIIDPPVTGISLEGCR